MGAFVGAQLVDGEVAELYEWYLMEGLMGAFVGAQLVDGERFDVAEINRRFTSGTESERWQIPAGKTDVYTSTEHTDSIDALIEVSAQVDTFLDTLNSSEPIKLPQPPSFSPATTLTALPCSSATTIISLTAI